MADDKSKTGKPDRIRVNTGERYEVEYWTKEFGVTEKDLIDAVRTVGPMVENVRAYLLRWKK